MRTIDHTTYRFVRNRGGMDRGLGSKDLNRQIDAMLHTPPGLAPVPFTRPAPPGPKPPINHSIEEAVKAAVEECASVRAPGLAV